MCTQYIAAHNLGVAHSYAIVCESTRIILNCRWQVLRSACGDICVGIAVDTGLSCDVSVPVCDTSTVLRRVLGDDGTACRFFFPFVVDIGCLYVGCTNFTFVEDGIFWDVYAVECADVEDAAVAELGEWSRFVEFEVTIYEDAAVAELNEVG